MDPVKNVFNGLAPGSGGYRTSRAPGNDFAKTLKSLYEQVDKEIQASDQMAEELAVGKRQDLHEVMIASQKADLSFRFLLQIRNKLLDAYQEVMRMSF